MKKCIVIEDSPAGVEAAKAAGMKVIGFTGGSHEIAASLQEKLESPNPQFITNSFEVVGEIPKYNAKLFSTRDTKSN